MTRLAISVAIALATATATASCGGRQPAPAYPPTSRVDVYFQGKLPAATFDIITEMSVTSNRSETVDELVARLRERARLAGANALIYVRYEKYDRSNESVRVGQDEFEGAKTVGSGPRGCTTCGDAEDGRYAKLKVIGTAVRYRVQPAAR